MLEECGNIGVSEEREVQAGKSDEVILCRDVLRDKLWSFVCIVLEFVVSIRGLATEVYSYPCKYIRPVDFLCG